MLFRSVGFSSAARYYGDGSALTGIKLDNLGNHIATTTLNMNGKGIINISSAAITGAGVTGSAPLFLVAGATLAVLNNGNAGIGTAVPATQLHLVNSIVSQSIGDASGPGQLRLDNGATSLSGAGGIEFKATGAANGSGSKIQAIDSGGSQLIFAGRQATGAWSEYMRVQAGGKVGIGTPNPNARLDVYSGVGTSVTITGTGNSGFAVTNNTGGQTWNTYVDNSGFYRIDRVGGGNELAVAPSGMVGVNTVAPSTILDVNGAFTARAESAGGQAFRAVGRAGDNLAWAPIAFQNDGMTATGGISYSTSAVTLSTGSALTPVTTWMPSGYVGVGVRAPDATLDVGGTGAVIIPVGTTGERPASPAAGMIRLNTDSGNLEYYDGGAWIVFGKWL